jgi:excisionase family DNA binding protein
MPTHEHYFIEHTEDGRFAVRAKESARASAVFDTQEEGEIMTANEVAEYLSVDRTRIYRLLKRKELPGFKVGTDFRLRRADIDEWILKKRANCMDAPRPGART